MESDRELRERLRASHTVMATTVVANAREAQTLETRAMDAGLAVEARDWPCTVSRRDAPPKDAQRIELICPKDKVGDLMLLIESAPDVSQLPIALHVTDPGMGSYAYELWADGIRSR